MINHASETINETSSFSISFSMTTAFFHADSSEFHVGHSHGFSTFAA